LLLRGRGRRRRLVLLLPLVPLSLLLRGRCPLDGAAGALVRGMCCSPDRTAASLVRGRLCSLLSGWPSGRQWSTLKWLAYRARRMPSLSGLLRSFVTR
jgi:hypothetical protein